MSQETSDSSKRYNQATKAENGCDLEANYPATDRMEAFRLLGARAEYQKGAKHHEKNTYTMQGSSNPLVDK